MNAVLQLRLDHVSYNRYEFIRVTRLGKVLTCSRVADISDAVVSDRAQPYDCQSALRPLSYLSIEDLRVVHDKLGSHSLVSKTHDAVS